MPLSDKQWKKISILVSHKHVNTTKRGRPSLNKREVMNGILWVLEKGVRWKQMPDNYPQYQTCRNYFYEWSKQGTMKQVVTLLIKTTPDLQQNKILKYSNAKIGCISKKKVSAIIKKIVRYNGL